MTVTEDLRSANNLRRRILLVGRAGIAALVLAALVGQLVTSTAFWSSRGVGELPQHLVTYLSFFTVESNLLSAALLVTLVAAQLGRVRLGRRLDVLLLCATSCMALTGVVYNALMRGVELPPAATLDWANEVLHLVAPLWMVVDWCVSTRARRLHWRDLATVAALPAAWLGYTLLRAPRTPAEAATNPYWYPHLDPATYDNGAFGVATTCLGIAAALLLITAALLVQARWRGRSRP